jgi:hypothetical protein
MMFKNKFFNTSPYVLHNPTPHPLWESLVQEFFKTQKRKLKLKDLTIITWNNKDFKSLFEMSLDHLGLECIVLGKGITSWKNTLKITLARDILPKINTPFVMGVDAFDAIMLDDPSESIQILDFYKADMVFNATCGTAYSSKKLRDFCDKEFAESPMRHPNAGAWIAKTGFCQEFFNKLADVTVDELFKFMDEEEFPEEPCPRPEEWCVKSEQLRVKYLFERAYPQVTVDYQCRVFQVLNSAPCILDENQGVALTKMHL